MYTILLHNAYHNIVFFQKSQEQRAGGTVCINKPAVWKAFKSSIMGMEPCPQPKQVDERIVEEEQAQPRLIADEL